MDRRLYDLHAARAFLEAATLCLRYAAIYLRKTDDEGCEVLREIRARVEELVQRMEQRLSIYLQSSCDFSAVSPARRIIEEVIGG